MGPKSGLGVLEKRKLWALAGIRILDRTARSLVTLHRLCYRGSLGQ